MHECVGAQSLQSCPTLHDPTTLQSKARQAPLSMGFFRQVYWSGLPCLFQGIFPAQGSSLRLLCLLRWQVVFLTTGATWEVPHNSVENTVKYQTKKGTTKLYCFSWKNLASLPTFFVSLEELLYEVWYLESQLLQNCSKSLNST